MKVESIENLGRKSMAVLQTAQDIKDYQRQLDHEDNLKQKIREKESIGKNRSLALNNKDKRNIILFVLFCIVCVLAFVGLCHYIGYDMYIKDRGLNNNSTKISMFYSGNSDVEIILIYNGQPKSNTQPN